MVEKSSLNFEGLTVSNGNTGLRIEIPGLVTRALVELREDAEIITVVYSNFIQLDYDFSGQLLFAGIWLRANWDYVVATQPLVLPTGVVEKTISGMGYEDVMVCIELSSGFQTRAIGRTHSGGIVKMGDEALTFVGRGSAEKPLTGYLGEKVVVAIAWDEQNLRMGMGEGRYVRTVPIARLVDMKPFFDNLDRESLSNLFKSALPQMRLIEDN